MIDPLSKGITGFYSGGDKPPEVEHERFVAACKAMTGRTLRVLGYDTRLRGSVRSFHQAEVRVGERCLQLLGNRHYPLLAFATQGPADGVEFVFVDPPALDQLVPEPFRLLSQSEVEEPVRGRSDDRLRLLTPAELEQVAYWKPARVGDVIFNLWD